MKSTKSVTTKSSIRKLFFSDYQVGITRELAFKLYDIFKADSQTDNESSKLQLDTITFFNEKNEAICRMLSLQLDRSVYKSLLNQSINKREFINNILNCNITQAHKVGKLNQSQGVVLAIGAPTVNHAISSIKYEQEQYHAEWLPIKSKNIMRLIQPYGGYKSKEDFEKAASSKPTHVKEYFHAPLDKKDIILGVALSLTGIFVFIFFVMLSLSGQGVIHPLSNTYTVIGTTVLIILPLAAIGVAS